MVKALVGAHPSHKAVGGGMEKTHCAYRAHVYACALARVCLSSYVCLHSASARARVCVLPIDSIIKSD